MWTLKCYTRANGKNEIRDWYEACDMDLKGHVSAFMGDLRQSDSKYWGNLGAKFPKGKGKGLIQINIKYKGLEHRLLGYFDASDFVICDYFLKKNKSDNDRAYERAQNRRKKIEQGMGSTEEYNFSTKTDS